LFIHGNLSGLNDRMLYDVFKPHGDLVGVKIHVAAEAGGFGYVSYRTPDACVSAIRAINLVDAFGTGSTLKIMLKKGEEGQNEEAQRLIEQAMVTGLRDPEAPC